MPKHKWNEMQESERTQVNMRKHGRNLVGGCNNGMLSFSIAKMLLLAFSTIALL